MVSRADRSAFAEWWWTVDKALLTALIILLVGGVVLSLGASPPVAERLGFDPFYLVRKHLVFFIPTVLLLIAVSFLSTRLVRRLSLILFVGMVGLMFLTLIIGVEVKGARRWMDVAGFSLQPSEFMKPAFVILCAWLFTEKSRNGEVPGTLFAFLLLAIVIVLLVAQPDFGQTILTVTTWGAVFFLAGMAWTWIVAIGGLAATGVAAAYTLIPHVASRIDRFLDPSAGDNYQIERSIQAFVHGGWLGVGPGEGTVKRVLPDAHADFIFAVAAEEFGIIICICLVAVFGFIVFRGLYRALQCEDAFSRVAAAGLIVIFGVQSVINMAVNLQLMPSKGMTLPFVSYGGSSMFAIAITMGLFLALTRRRPQEKRVRREAPIAAVPHPA